MRYAAHWLALLLLVAPAVADEEMAKDAVKKIKDAVRSKDPEACRTAFKEAEFFKPDAAQAKRVSNAIASAIKTLEKKYPDIAIDGLRSLRALESPGATRKIAGLLKPPKRVAYERISLYLTAIRITGELHEPTGLAPLEKLVTVRSTELAVAATEAIAQYRVLDPVSRLKLIGRLIRTLDSFEKKRARAKAHDDRLHYQKVTGNLIDCLAKLSEHGAATTSREWAVWAKAEKKRANKPSQPTKK